MTHPSLDDVRRAVVNEEDKLDAMMTEAFSTNEAPMLDYVKLKFKVKTLRRLAQSYLNGELQSSQGKGGGSVGYT